MVPNTAKKKVAAKKTTENKKAKSKKTSVKKKILSSLPESIENLKSVQQLSSLFDEMQDRVSDVKQEASKEFNKLIKLYEGNYQDLEKKVQQVTKDAKKQAQSTMMNLVEKWHEHKDKVPKKISTEVDSLLIKIAERTQNKSSTAKTKKAASTTKKKKVKTI